MTATTMTKTERNAYIARIAEDERRIYETRWAARRRIRAELKRTHA